MPEHPGEVLNESGGPVEEQLCLHCLAPNDPAAHFCTTCRAPLSSYAATGPFERLFAEGAVYREAAQHPRSVIVVLGVWLLFGTIALAGLGGILMGLSDGSATGLRFSVPGAAVSILSVAMIWRTTRNYFSRSKPETGNIP